MRAPIITFVLVIGIQGAATTAGAMAQIRPRCDTMKVDSAFGRCMLRNARDDLRERRLREEAGERRSGRRPGPVKMLQRKVTSVLADHWAR